MEDKAIKRGFPNSISKYVIKKMGNAWYAKPPYSMWTRCLSWEEACEYLQERYETKGMNRRARERYIYYEVTSRN